MKFPVFEAIEFVRRFEKNDGGSTNPYLVKVYQDSNSISYVVKLFKPLHEDLAYSTVNEVFMNILAQEFDLLVPDAALVNFSDVFIKTFLPMELQQDEKIKDKRLKFASRYIENTKLPKISMLKDYDIASVYAFDNLLRNADRRTEKPNMLYLEKESDLYLIDHELSLNITESFLEELKTSSSTYFKNRHIFYSYLQKMKLEKKKHIFDTFQNSLKNINISKLNGYAEQLEQANYTLNNFELLKEYLLFAKREHQKFINSLISGLHD